MSVRTFPTAMLPEMIGDVVDMPNPSTLVIKTKNGYFTIHENEVREYFYSV